MGRSVTCNFQCTVDIGENKCHPMYGAMTLKDIKGILLSEMDYQKKYGNTVNKVLVFAQTKAGERYLKGYDYLEMSRDFRVTYKNIEIPEEYLRGRS